jgi:hypothetical protein
MNFMFFRWFELGEIVAEIYEGRVFLGWLNRKELGVHLLSEDFMGGGLAGAQAGAYT